MSNVKFNAWNKETKTMHYDILNPDNFSFSFLNMDVYEWLQFTGLSDKNGKEIYKGDVCKTYCVDSGNEVMSVNFNNGAFCFEYHGWNISDWKTHNIEITGNIFQHPHLLNQ